MRADLCIYNGGGWKELGESIKPSALGSFIFSRFTWGSKGANKERAGGGDCERVAIMNGSGTSSPMRATGTKDASKRGTAYLLDRLKWKSEVTQKSVREGKKG